MATALALSAIATAVAGKGVVEVRKGYREPLNIWTCTVMPPASRKSPVFSLMVSVIEEHEQEVAWRSERERTRAADHRKVLEIALKKAIERAAKASTEQDRADALRRLEELRTQLSESPVPTLPRLVAKDVTSERLTQLMAENDGRMAILAPEGDIFRIMAGHYSNGSAMLAPYKHGWTGNEPLRDDRVGRDGTFVPNPLLTLGLTIQPSVLDSLHAKNCFRGEGILGRLLWVYPLSPLGHRKTGDDVPPFDEAAAATYRQRLRALLEAEPAGLTQTGAWIPHVLTLDATARSLLYGFEAEIEQQLAPDERLHGIADWAGKLVGQVARLAGLIHLADRASEPCFWDQPVSAQAMATAVRMGAALISHALAVFEEAHSSETSLATYVLERALEADPSTLTVRQLHQDCRGKRAIPFATDLQTILRLLEQRGYLRIFLQKSTGGRPPSPRIEINPQVREEVNKRHKSGSDAEPPREGPMGSASKGGEVAS
jgi:hypothetical protein